MNNQEKLQAIDAWQNGYVHSLTCGVCRADLLGDEREGDVILSCPHCDYVQEWVPDGVYLAWEGGYHEYMKKIMEEADDG